MLNAGLDFRNLYVAGSRLLVGGGLLFASLTKLHHPFLFLSDIYSYELVGRTTGLGIAIILPYLELVISFCLLFGIFLPAALAMASLLGLSFVFATVSVVNRGLDISCGCFSGSEIDKVGYDTVVRAVLLAIIAASCLTILCFPKGNLRPANLQIRE
jgi:hypothetical protein